MSLRALLILIMLAFVALTVAACERTGGRSAAPEPRVVRVEIDQDDLELVVGASAALSVSVETMGGASAEVTWSVLDAAVATVDDEGVVRALAPGATEVSAVSVVDASRSDTVTVSVTAAPAPDPDPDPDATGALVIRYEGLPSDATAVLAVLPPGDGAAATRIDVSGPSGEVQRALPPGSYALRASDVYALGEDRGLYAVAGEASTVAEVSADETTVVTLVYEPVGDLDASVRVVAGEDARRLVSIDGSQLTFSQRPDALDGVGPGDVVVVQLGEGVDVARVLGAEGVASASLADWWRDGVITTFEQLRALTLDIAYVVMDITDAADEWVLEALPANLVDIATRVQYTDTIRREELVLPPAAVWTGPLSGFSGGLVLRDVRVNATFSARRVNVDVDARVGLDEAYLPLAFPSAECYLGLAGPGVGGWVLLAAATALDIRCSKWMVVEVLDVVVEVGDFDLNFSVDVPADDLKLVFAAPIVHAKAAALVLSVDVELGANMPALTWSARERDWRFGAWYENPGTGGVWLEEPNATDISAQVTFGDRFGGVTVELDGRVHASLALTDPTMILQAYVGAGPGLSIATTTGDPRLERDLWPFEATVFVEGKAGVRYIWQRTPRPVFFGSMTPRFRFAEWPLVGDAKLALTDVPDGARIFYQEQPGGTVREATTPFVVIDTGQPYEVWIDAPEGATLAPDPDTCPVDAVSDGGARIALRGMAIRDVCMLGVVEAAAPVSVAVTPAQVTLAASASAQFTANVAGTTNTNVTWTRSCGTISGSGNTITYTAPATVPTGGTCTVTARSVADTTKSASATVTITAAPVVAVSLSPSSASLQVNGSRSFTANVTGTTNTNVTWTRSCGSISGSGNTITYTAPPSAGTCWLTASSVAAPSASAQARIDVVQPLSFASIATGNYSTSFGITSDGVAYAWGANGQGQLGDGSTTSRSTPVAVSGLASVELIDGGGTHSLAMIGGRVWAWGDNYDGQLANAGVCVGDDCSSSVPVEAGSFTQVIDVAAGPGYSMALRSYGNVFMWGRNYGPTPVMVTGVTNVTAISAGQNHMLALRSDGTVWSWGSNGAGELGSGNYVDRSTPGQVLDITNVVAIAAGDSFSLALRGDGTVWAWGYNNLGQLGDGTTVWRTRPVRVSGISGATAIAAGGRHGLALLSDGSVRAWGHNNVGQVGDGGGGNRLSPVVVPGVEDAVQVAAGSSHSVVLLSDGRALAWGFNGSGQVGDGTTETRFVPTLVGGQ